MSKQSLIKPGAGQTTQCVVQHGHVYSLDFDTSSVIFGRSGGDLLMTFEDGASIILRDFYNETQIGDFFLELEDGNVLSARSVIESMEYMLDDFVSGGNQVYTAEAHQSDQDLSSSSVSIHGEEDDSSLALPMLEAQALEGPTAEDSFAANAGPLTHVTSNDEGAGVFDLHMGPTLLQAEYGKAGTDAPEESQATMPDQGILDLEDSPPFSAFVSPLDSGNDSLDIITPRAQNEAGVNPFIAHTDGLSRESSAEDKLDQSVFLANNSKESDLLLLEDLLDTTMPEEMAAVNDHVPAFEELFAAGPDEVLSIKIDPTAYTELDPVGMSSATESASVGSEQVLLAFLRMGSF